MQVSQSEIKSFECYLAELSAQTEDAELMELLEEWISQPEEEKANGYSTLGPNSIF